MYCFYFIITFVFACVKILVFEIDMVSFRIHPEIENNRRKCPFPKFRLAGDKMLFKIQKMRNEL